VPVPAGIVQFTEAVPSLAVVTVPALSAPLDAVNVTATPPMPLSAWSLWWLLPVILTVDVVVAPGASVSSVLE